MVVCGGRAGGGGVGGFGVVGWWLVGVLCLVGVVGCGGSGSGGGLGSGGLPVGVVAVVGGHRVSVGLIGHWTHVEGRIASEVEPGVGDSKWVEPDPPSFSVCARRLAPEGSAGGGLVAYYRGECRKEYGDLQTKALVYLLRYFWDLEQAAAQGIRVSAGEVERAYQVYTQREYPQPGELQRLLSYSGMSVADEMLRVKKSMLEGKLLLSLAGRLRAVSGSSPERLAEQAQIKRGELTRLLSETSCRAGYVVEVCRQYRGTQRVKS
jgi:hypothetical protein